MNKAQALQQFWSGFLPAYDESTVPKDAQMPYITYTVSDSFLDFPVPLTASLWYKSQSWEEITLKSYEVSNAISLGGKVIQVDGGRMWIYRGSPFAQRVRDEDDTVRRMLINITVEYFTAD